MLEDLPAVQNNEIGDENHSESCPLDSDTEEPHLFGGDFFGSDYGPADFPGFDDSGPSRSENEDDHDDGDGDGDGDGGSLTLAVRASIVSQ